MLDRAVAMIGPPAAGKTTLTMQLGALPGCGVFRLREWVPDTILAATATSAERLGWIDNLTVTRALSRYVESVVNARTVYTVLLDNFPGTDTQAYLLLSVLRRLAPACVVQVVELIADPLLRERRVRDRRVCHHCEHDPIHDPRLPALSSPADPWRCARCGNVLHPRRGDAPRLLEARTRRYEHAAIGIRQAFARSDIPVVQLDSGRPPSHAVSELSPLLMIRSTTP